MNELYNLYLSPAIFIALCTLIIQGVFSIINSFHQRKLMKINIDTNKTSFVVSIFNFIDNLPFDDGEKFSMKVKISKEYLTNIYPKEIIREIEEIIKKS